MYAIIGANGFLGNYIIRAILNQTNDEILAVDTNCPEDEARTRVEWRRCNILNDDDFDGIVNDLRNLSPVKVIFLAAYHHPDLVAKNPQTAWSLNVTTLSKCINKLHFVSRLFYASTDSVYGNSIYNYHFKETDDLNPVNIYGKNKAAAEAIIKYAGFTVVRYPFLIGPSLVNGKKHFYDQIVKNLKSGERVEMFCDSYRSSLDFNTASALMINLCELNRDIPSIINISGDEDLSKYDVGQMIAQKLGISSEQIVPVKMSERTDIFETPRAASTLMDNSLLKELLHLDSVHLSL